MILVRAGQVKSIRNVAGGPSEKSSVDCGTDQL